MIDTTLDDVAEVKCPEPEIMVSRALRTATVEQAYNYPGQDLYPGMSLYPGTSAVPADLDVDAAFDAAFKSITDNLRKEKEERTKPPLMRLWDGDWNLRGIVRREIAAKFQTLDNETGTGSIDLPLDYFMSQWLVDVDNRGTTNVHITVDKDGTRWSGMMDSVEVLKDESGARMCRVLFKHDYEHTKHILCWVHAPSNTVV